MPNLYDAQVQVESSGNPTATSIKGARGLMQIMPDALADYNTYNKTSLTMDDMYDEDINRRVGEWYMGTRIPQMLKHYKIPDNIATRLWAYNGGIGRVRDQKLYDETKNYIIKVIKGMGEFDPHGSGYNYPAALEAGAMPDETWHWPTQNAETGELWKGYGHYSIDKSKEAEAKLGNEYKWDEGSNRYYSRKKGGL